MLYKDLLFPLYKPKQRCGCSSSYAIPSLLDKDSHIHTLSIVPCDGKAGPLQSGVKVALEWLADACMFPSFCYHCEVLLLFYCTCQSWGMCLPASNDSKHVPIDSGQNLVIIPRAGNLISFNMAHP